MAKSPKQTPQAAPTRTRVNIRGLIIVGGILLAGLLAIVPIRILQERRLRQSAMEQATASIKRGDNALSSRLLENYLRSWPTDVEALNLQGDLLAKTARSLPQYLGAAAVNDQLLRLDPSGPHAKDARRRIVEMYVEHGNLVLRSAAAYGTKDTQAQELRFRAAETLARAMVKDDPKDADAHRLLAMALDGEASAGDDKALPEAIAEYEKALAIDPANTASALLLAGIYADKTKDPAAADRVMDALLKANPNSIDVRLARHKIALKMERETQAREEIAKALALDPDSADVRYIAAQDALRLNDPKAARAHLDAIPKAQADSINVRILRGQIDFAELHPDEAIDEWRKGLTAVGGSDSDLTFRLAYILIQLNRLSEARPLIEQYLRLEPDKTKPMARLLNAFFEEKAGHPAAAIAGLELARDKVDQAWEAELNLVLGRCYAAIGDEARALTAFRRAAVIAPKSMGPRRAIASMIQAQNPDGAIAELEHGLAMAPEDPASLVELARAIINRQLSLPEGQRRWERPEELIARADKIHPNDPAVLSVRADLLAAKNQLQEAITLLSRATEGEARKRPEIWQALIVGLGRQGKLDEALKTLDRAESPENAGDHVELRMLRARLLIQTGHAQAAKDLLAKSPQTLPARERAALARGRGDLLREFGDRDGARQAYAEWASLSPEDSLPGLFLVELGQTGDAEATRLGLEALRKVGGDDEPYGLAARALALLGEPKPGQVTPPEQLDQADRIIERLQTIAPLLPVGHLLRGVLLERRLRPEEAIGEFKKALKSNTQASALGRLVALYTRLKRYDDLAELRKQMGATVVDRLSAVESLKLGDKERAEQIAAQLVEGQPDSLQFRSAQASLLRELGRPLEAQETLRELTVRQPNEPGPWLALLLFQIGQKDQTGVKATIDRAAKTYKGERPDLLIARCRWLGGEVPEATRLYDAALAQHPDDMTTLKSAAEFFEGIGKNDRTETIVRQALKLDPTASWAARWLAILVSSKGVDRWDEAWKLIAPGASAAGDLPEDRLIRAAVLGRSPDPSRRDEALKLLSSLAEDLPASSPIALEARVRLGQFYLDVNRPEEAVRVILPASDETSVANPAALSIAVEALSRTKRPAEAQQRLDRLVEVEPSSPRVVSSKYWVARANGKVDDAAALIEAYYPEVETAPNGQVMSLAFLNLMSQLEKPEVTERFARTITAKFPGLGWTLARILIGLDRIPEALDACRDALAAGSVSESMETALSLLDKHSGDRAIVDRISAIAEMARTKEPKDMVPYIGLAAVRHIQGRYDEELALYDEVLKLNPASFGFLNNKAWTISEVKGQHEEGLKLVDEAIRRVGRLAPFLDTRGVILTRLKRTDEAIQDLEESAKLSSSPTTLFHLARAYLQAGRTAEHRKVRDQVKAANFDPKRLDPNDRSDFDAVMQP
ncbi:tetratricopeptide repeat protein [Tundrisphaera sp. TA3]|uniref:tetratricopeptide repeat protein n=1 Tax=Tundrisphaera sp. TA3 TaxID=3435775 RepID=UPI003EBAF1DC